MLITNLEINQESRLQKELFSVRALAQAAEKFGWTIAASSYAYTLAGGKGLILLQLSMIFSAAFTVSLSKILNLRKGSILIRWALLFRIASFVTLAVSKSIVTICLAGSLSGIFVGLFWPSFYSIQRTMDEEIEHWYRFEKFAGVILALLAALWIIDTGETLVLYIATTVAAASCIMTFKLDGVMTPDPGEESAPISTILPLGLFSSLEGSMNSSIMLFRGLTVLSGTITILGLPEVLTLSLLIAICQLSGVVISIHLKKSQTRKSRINIALYACILSSLILSNERFWALGIILFATSSSMLFPVSKNIIEDSWVSIGMGNNSNREHWRNYGRVAGIACIGIAWLTGHFFLISSLAIMTNSILLFYCWRMFPNSYSNIDDEPLEFSPTVEALGSILKTKEVKI